MPREYPVEEKWADEPEFEQTTTYRGDSPIEGNNDHNIIIETGENGVTRKIKMDLPADTAAKNLGPNPYGKWIHMARALDAWRPFPRAFIIIYMMILYKVIDWYLLLPDPSMEQSGLISIIVGAGAAWFGLYVGSGGRGPSE
jgi:hypothetical protein